MARKLVSGKAGAWMPLEVSHVTYCLQVLMWPEFLQTQICECPHQSNQVAELRGRWAEWQVGMNSGLLAKCGMAKDCLLPAFWFWGMEISFRSSPIQLILKSALLYVTHCWTSLNGGWPPFLHSVLALYPGRARGCSLLRAPVEVHLFWRD